MMTSCAFCEGKPQYRDRQTGQALCLEHARLGVVAARRRSSGPALAIRPATATDTGHIEELSLYFWDEVEVDCFDRQYDVLHCPAFVACDGDAVVGLASYTVETEWDAVVLVVLNVLPGYQGRGAGSALIDSVCDEAARRGLKRVIVVTSNDDLLVLALYQRYGFYITEVIPGRIAHDHGGAFPGFAGIKVRDEIRLAYEVQGKWRQSLL
jgi:GNAT superfamily N-acetyltransferase